MKVYNTLSRSKETFEPINENNVNMYACGITVSGEAHIGHAYQALIYDIMRKFLIKQGYNVTYARNYTDVDDKIIAKSKETGIPADDYAKIMIEKIDNVMRKFNVDDPDIWLKATDSIPFIIDFILQLINKDKAYATPNGDVYFNVENFPSYGRLSNVNLEDVLNGVRVENDEQKKSPLDFALWKSAKEGEICWDSPWGKGRPGWHIECSAMNKRAFGEQIDLHGGGRDLIFPHHENEIAQTEALTGKQFVKYWTHNGLIKVNGQKMSKSLGNSLLLSDLLDKYSNETIKFALLQTNYKNDINITDDLFPDAEKHLCDFYTVFNNAIEKNIKIEGEYPEIDKDFNDAMSDDFNTALALANLFAYFKKARALIEQGDNLAGNILSQIKTTYNLLGIFKIDAKQFIDTYGKKENVIPEEIKELAKNRWEAKLVRNFALADSIRKQIADLGYVINDKKDGYDIEKK